MSYESHTTYPIPRYRPRWFYKMKSECPECNRLTSMRDNTYGSRALLEFGYQNHITCVLCGKKFTWQWLGMGHWGGYWGWREPKS